MTKTDDLIAEIDQKLSQYLKAIGEFTIEKLNQKVVLTGHYKSSQYRTCCACGKPNIIEIFTVSNQQGQIYEIGSDCIEAITNQKILNFYKNIQQKKENINKNSKAITVLEGFIPAIENGTSPINVSNKGYERLNLMYDRLCKGIDALDSQWQLFYYYLRKINEA